MIGPNQSITAWIIDKVDRIYSLPDPSRIGALVAGVQVMSESFDHECLMMRERALHASPTVLPLDLCHDNGCRFRSDGVIGQGLTDEALRPRKGAEVIIAAMNCEGAAGRKSDVLQYPFPGGRLAEKPQAWRGIND